MVVVSYVSARQAPGPMAWSHWCPGVGVVVISGVVYLTCEARQRSLIKCAACTGTGAKHGKSSKKARGEDDGMTGEECELMSSQTCVIEEMDGPQQTETVRVCQISAQDNVYKGRRGMNDD